MHPATMMLLAQGHQNALLDEARGERLATTAGGRLRCRSGPDGCGRTWRMFVGAAVIDLGTWLAGGRIEPLSDPRS